MTDTQTDSTEAEKQEPAFEEGVAFQQAGAGDALDVSLDGYEGPLHVLLNLART